MQKFSRARSLLIFLLFPALVNGISRNDLFPYGTPSGDERLPPDAEDISSREVTLNTYVKFFGREYGTIYVNENGLLSFLTDIPNFFNVQFPLDYPIIAALYSDVDCRAGGTVWFRKTTDQYLMKRAQNMVTDKFGQVGFQPTELFIATWDKVGYFEQKKDKINTFQIVVASDDFSSYVFFLYPNNGIQWIKAQGKNRNMPDAKAQAGIISGEGKHITLRGSGTDQVRRLDKWSNSNEAGVWMFRIGLLKPNEEVEQPRIMNKNEFEPDWSLTCSVGKSLCHSEAKCLDHNQGFCCQCNPGWFGDGQTCLPFGGPQRVSGRVSGIINSESFTDQDLHSYVVTEDGRTYTAISKITSRIGSEMQGLISVGTPIAWLFGQTLSGARNGFELTGGALNYSAVVKFPDTGHSANIRYYFLGLDAFDYLKMEGSIRGTLPKIDGEIELQPYTEEFSRAGPGKIVAQSKGNFGIKGTNQKINYEMEHNIEFGGCAAYERNPDSRAMRFKSSKNYINYNSNEQVVRYASTSNLIPLGANEDPCRQFVCNPRSYCLVENGQPECTCNPGFTSYVTNNEKLCKDIDECQEGTHDCSSNADCVNQQGSYGCLCKKGYVGNGIKCEEEISCEKLACDPNAECVISRYGQPECRCLEGYQGDGKMCSIIPSSIKISSYSKPLFSTFNNTRDIDQVETTKDLGPEISHIYTVTNLGEHTVGKVKIYLTWPLHDTQGRQISYLLKAPYAKYGGPNGDYKDDCYIDAEYVNNLKLSLPREKREGDYYFDANFTEASQGYDALTDYDREQLELYGDMEEYDYSRFEVYNTERPPARTESPGAIYGVLDQVNEIFKSTKGMMDNLDLLKPKPGHLQIMCKINLAPQEAADLVINARIFSKSLIENYPTVSKFDFPSKAEIAPNEGIVFLGSNKSQIVTKVSALEPTFAQVPGQGVECGSQTCSRYADCYQSFESDASSECRCVTGFKGDGLQCDSLDPSEEVDCRQSLGCHTDATCAYDAYALKFTCQCNEGYQGDGYICTLKQVYCNVLNNCSPYAKCIQGYGDSFICQCETGYEGDGYSCRKVQTVNPIQQGDPQPSCSNNQCSCPDGYSYENYQCNKVDTSTPSPNKDLCEVDDECHPNARCVYDDQDGYQKCQCNKFYEGDGLNCVPGPDAGCDITENCDSNAICKHDPNSLTYYCKCNNGFSGDGTFCKKDVVGCNIINNCAKYASCEFDFEERGYRCICDTRRGFFGDGFVCRPSQSCSENPFICDRNALCQTDQGASGVCKCRENFVGDGYTCEAVPVYEGNFLLMGNGMAVTKVPFGAASKPGYPIVVQPKQTSTGIDIDCIKGQVYWTDTTGKRIMRSGYDGKNVEVFLRGDMSFPEGLALDWTARNIYWVDSGKLTIEVANLDTKVRATLIDEYLRNPRGLTLHSTMGRLFWSDWNRKRPKIEASNLDGSDRMTLVDTSLGTPNSLTMDLNTYEVCWTDGGSALVTAKIECIGINGENRRSLIELESGSSPFGIALTSNNVFWTDWNRPGVHGAVKESGESLTPLKNILQGISKPFELVSVPKECPRVSNPCEENLTCQNNHICLSNGRGDAVCKCSDASSEDGECQDIFP